MNNQPFYMAVTKGVATFAGYTNIKFSEYNDWYGDHPEHGRCLGPKFTDSYSAIMPLISTLGRTMLKSFVMRFDDPVDIFLSTPYELCVNLLKTIGRYDNLLLETMP